jgi:hypothetical protein
LAADWTAVFTAEGPFGVGRAALAEEGALDVRAFAGALLF